jgi:hypothetical protein
MDSISHCRQMLAVTAAGGLPRRQPRRAEPRHGQTLIQVIQHSCCSAQILVALMTPGLAFFYGGLVERKNVLSIMMQSLPSATSAWFAWLFDVLWSDLRGIIGDPAYYAFLRGVNCIRCIRVTMPVCLSSCTSRIR